MDEILRRLDRIATELTRLNDKLDTQDGLQRISHELKTLNEALQTIAYASLSSQGPGVKRRGR